jgi:PAS domain S-box-containing protein
MRWRAGSLSDDRTLVDPERRSEHLEDTSSLAEAILEQIADPVIFADATGTIRRWNPAAALFGYSRRGGRSEARPDHPRTPAGAPLARLQHRHDRRGNEKLQGRPTQTRATHQTGRRLYVEMTFSLVKEQAGGSARGVVAVARDATERIEQQRAEDA